MDVAITIVMLVPVLLAVALIIGVIRRNITERQAGDPVDISGAIPAVIVLMVAVLIIVAMGNAASPYWYDEDSGELTINQNVSALDVQPWDSYASDVRSLVIEDGVTAIGEGAFDTLTGLEYVSIPDSMETITSSAFGVTLKDYLDQTITEPEAGEYVGTGDGTLYHCDESIFTYTSTSIGRSITGLTSDASGAVSIVLPSEIGGGKIISIASNAFSSNTALAKVLHVPGSEIVTVNLKAFYGCTSLVEADLPDTVTEIASECFRGCTSLASFDYPGGLQIIGPNAFRETAITSAILPDGLNQIKGLAYQSLTSLETVYMPGSLQSVATSVFTGCTGITSVTFGSGFAPTEFNATWASSWTFYGSDGTTELDKTVASNLAGKTFQGTAAALVEVADGQLSLTPQQLQQVQLHTQELQQQELDIQPLPFQPTVQTQDQEPVSA